MRGNHLANHQDTRCNRDNCSPVFYSRFQFCTLLGRSLSSGRPSVKRDGKWNYFRKHIVPLSVPFLTEAECYTEHIRAMREGNRPNSSANGNGECLQNYGADAASGVPAALQQLLPELSVSSGAVTSRQEATRMIGPEVTTCRVKARIGRKIGMRHRLSLTGKSHRKNAHVDIEERERREERSLPEIRSVLDRASLPVSSRSS